MSFLLPQLIYHLCNNCQNHSKGFVDIDSIILKFIWEGQSTKIAKTILKKNNKVEGISLPDCKTFYILVVTKTMCFFLGGIET